MSSGEAITVAMVLLILVAIAVLCAVSAGTALSGGTWRDAALPEPAAPPPAGPPPAVPPPAGQADVPGTAKPADPVPADSPAAGPDAFDAAPPGPDPVTAGRADAALLDPGPHADAVEERRCAMESALVRHLLDGTLQRADYLRAMSELAATDATRKPIVMPPRRRY